MCGGVHAGRRTVRVAWRVGARVRRQQQQGNCGRQIKAKEREDGWQRFMHATAQVVTAEASAGRGRAAAIVAGCVSYTLATGPSLTMDDGTMYVSLSSPGNTSKVTRQWTGNTAG